MTKQITNKATKGTDKFGFRLGSVTSKAAGLYAAKGGATAAEILKACGSPQRNLLTAAEERGHKVTTVTRKCKVSGKEVTAWHLA